MDFYEYIRPYVWGDMLVLSESRFPGCRRLAVSLAEDHEFNDIVVAENDHIRRKALQQIDSKNVRIAYVDIDDSQDFNMMVFELFHVDCVLWLFPSHITPKRLERLSAILGKYGTICILEDRKTYNDDMFSDRLMHSDFEELRRFGIGGFFWKRYEVIFLGKRDTR